MLFKSPLLSTGLIDMTLKVLTRAQSINSNSPYGIMIKQGENCKHEVTVTSLKTLKLTNNVAFSGSLWFYNAISLTSSLYYCIPQLTHISLAFLRDIGKQSRPRSDAEECGICSGSPLFAYRMFYYNLNKMKNTAQHP